MAKMQVTCLVPMLRIRGEIFVSCLIPFIVCLSVSIVNSFRQHIVDLLWISFLAMGAAVARFRLR